MQLTYLMQCNAMQTFWLKSLPLEVSSVSMGKKNAPATIKILGGGPAYTERVYHCMNNPTSSYEFCKVPLKHFNLNNMFYK